VKQKEQAIISAAQELFGRYGYKKVSIDEIVNAAHVAKGTFYLYFKSKDELYLRIFNDYYNNDIRSGIEELMARQKDIRLRLYEDMIEGLRFLLDRPILMEILHMNPNYLSQSVTYSLVTQTNMELIELMFKGHRKALRKDLTAQDLSRLYSLFLTILHTEDPDSREFWTVADKTAKVIIDGMLSTHKWNTKGVK
jgi:AcrR family transcriptional regulator